MNKTTFLNSTKWLVVTLTLVLSLASISAYAVEKVTYYHTDALGSPIAGTDATGNMLWKEDYRPYGERLRKQTESATNSRWYTGHVEDKETGLTYAGARYYDPVLGRFLAIDSAGFNEVNLQSFNRYLYANSNPYAYIDPDGRTALTIGTGVVILGAGALTYSSLPKESRDRFNNSVYEALNRLGKGHVDSRSGPYFNEKANDTSTGSPDDLLKDTVPQNKKKKSEKSEKRDFVGGGGFDTANDKFDNTLRPKNVKDRGNGVRTGELDDGTKVTVRPKNSPSIDVKLPNKKPIKVRF